MLLKPDEVTNLKKGRQVYVEIKEGDVRLLKRNFCGVYELFYQETPEYVEYFEDLNLFKNRYGNVHKKFPLYNILRQRLDIFPVAENMNSKEILRWFSDYGKIIFNKSVEYDGLEIDYYSWISDSENTLANFQIVRNEDRYTLNISPKTYKKIA